MKRSTQPTPFILKPPVPRHSGRALAVIARTVKTKRLIILGVLAALVIAYAISILPNLRRRAEWKQTVAALQGLSHERIEAAVQAFVRDRKASDNSVSLSTLVSGGYLRPEDIRGLEQKDVTISLTANETTPNAFWITVRASDGSAIVALADGSVAGYSPQLFEELRKNTGQAVQRIGASRFAQIQIEHHRRLAPIADLCVSRLCASALPTPACCA